MTRLIDADALTEQIQNMCHYEYMANWLGVLIDTQPTVKVEPIEVPKPVRHGRWACDEGLYTEGCAQCSVCKTTFYVDDLYCVGEKAQSELPNYCPHCGARMDAERKEE